MTTTDHRAEAIRLAEKAEDTIAHVYGTSTEAQTYALLAQVHVGLATDPGEVEELKVLRDLIRQVLLNHADGDADSETFVLPLDVAERLRKAAQ